MSMTPEARAAVKYEKGRVLVVSYHLPPDISPGSLRVSGLMNGLLREGWDVSAVTADAAPSASSDFTSKDRLAAGIDVARTSHWDAYGRIRKIFRLDIPASGLLRILRLPAAAACRALAFPDRYAGWIVPLVVSAWKRIGDKNIDIVFSSSPPHSSHLAIYVLSYFKRFKWIADFRDPWTAPNRRGKSGILMVLRRRLEKQVLKRCDRIIANTPGNREALLKTFSFLEHGKVTVITNAFETETDEEEPARKTEIGECDLVYTGEIYQGMLDLILEAMQIIAGNQTGQLPVFHIYGIMTRHDVDKISRLGFEKNFIYHGFIPYRESVQIMKRARALLLLLPWSGDSESWVPSKLYRYIGSGRPVLAVVPPGDASRILEETGAGLAVTDRDPKVVADKLERFVESLRHGKLTARRDEEKIRKYSMDSIVAQLDRIMQQETGD